MYKIINRFFQGVFCGVIFCSLVYVLFVAVNTWIDKAKLSRALHSVSAFQKAIDLKMMNHEAIEAGYLAHENFEDVAEIYLSSDGDIFFKTTRNSLIWLHPVVEDQKVTWRCLGAPIQSVPEECKRVTY